MTRQVFKTKSMRTCHSTLYKMIWKVLVLTMLLSLLINCYFWLQLGRRKPVRDPPPVFVRDPSYQTSFTMFDKMDPRIANLTTKLINKYRVDHDYALSGDPWKVAKTWLTGRLVHPGNTPELGAVLSALQTKKILSADMLYLGKQLKMLLYLDGGQKVVFRPKMYERESILKTEWVRDVSRGWRLRRGHDRHNGEIAAYHLGRILEFRRTPLTIGRYIHVETEIIPVATPELKSNLFLDRDGNICFKRPKSPLNKHNIEVCGDGQVLEGCVVLWLPTNVTSMLTNPWKNIHQRGGIDMNSSACNTTNLLKGYHIESSTLLLDIIDMAIFDFLIGNIDRNRLELLESDNASMIVILDNAKSFINPGMHEELLYILEPLYQCCQLRRTTWNQMLLLKDIVGDVLEAVLDQDPIAPVLTQEHLDGVNKRLQSAINAAQQCINTSGETAVLVIDR